MKNKKRTTRTISISLKGMSLKLNPNPFLERLPQVREKDGISGTPKYKKKKKKSSSKPHVAIFVATDVDPNSNFSSFQEEEE